MAIYDWVCFVRGVSWYLPTYLYVERPPIVSSPSLWTIQSDHILQQEFLWDSKPGPSIVLEEGPNYTHVCKKIEIENKPYI